MAPGAVLLADGAVARPGEGHPLPAPEGDHCTVLYCTVLYCTVLYCTVLYCTVLLLQVSDQALSSCSPPLTVSSSSRLGSLYGHCPPGTVVFLQPEQTLVFKVDVGWRYIVVSISEICIA